MRWNTSGLLSLLLLLLLFAALWLLQFSLVHSSFLFIFSSWHCSHEAVFLAFHPTLLFLGRCLSPFTSLYLRQIYKQLSIVCDRWQSCFDLQSSALPLYRRHCLNSGRSIDLMSGLDGRSNSPAPYSNERGKECVCACVSVCLSHAFPTLSSHKLPRFLSVVSLAGVCNIFLICCSTFAQRSRESMPLLSTSVGVNVWIAPTGNSFSGVWVCVCACVCVCARKYKTVSVSRSCSTHLSCRAILATEFHQFSQRGE